MIFAGKLGNKAETATPKPLSNFRPASRPPKHADLKAAARLPFDLFDIDIRNRA
jgi:hypothetical protein